MSNMNSGLSVGQQAQNLLEAFEDVSSGSDIAENQVESSDDEYQDSEENLGDEEDDGSDDDTGTGPVTVPGAAQGFAAAALPAITQGNAPADALTVADHPWMVGQPKSQPLAYWVPSNATGGQVWMSITFTVDFNDRASVEKAVVTRRQNIYRARKRFGLQLARASTANRQFTPANTAWMLTEHHTYAAANNRYRIPPAILTTRYIAQFPGDARTAAGLSAHILRTPELRAARASYR